MDISGTENEFPPHNDTLGLGLLFTISTTQSADIFYHTWRIWTHKMRPLSSIKCTRKRTAFASKRVSCFLIFLYFGMIPLVDSTDITASPKIIQRESAQRVLLKSNDTAALFAFFSALLSVLPGLIVKREVDSYKRWDFAHLWEDNEGSFRQLCSVTTARINTTDFLCCWHGCSERIWLAQII